MPPHLTFIHYHYHYHDRVLHCIAELVGVQKSRGRAMQLYPGITSFSNYIYLVLHISISISMIMTTAFNYNIAITYSGAIRI